MYYCKCTCRPKQSTSRESQGGITYPLTFSDQRQEDEWIVKFCIEMVRKDPRLSEQLREAYLKAIGEVTEI